LLEDELHEPIFRIEDRTEQPHRFSLLDFRALVAHSLRRKRVSVATS
jgi:hypothetical protein